MTSKVFYSNPYGEHIIEYHLSVMKNTFKTYPYKGREFVRARDVHEFLESNILYSDWILSNIELGGFIEDQDYVVFDNFVILERGNNVKKDHCISIHMAKDFLLKEDTPKGNEIREYFFQMAELAHIFDEKQPNTFAEILSIVADYVKEKDLKELSALEFNLSADSGIIGTSDIIWN